MTHLNILIAPDFPPERFAAWHILNTWLQRKSGIALHLLTPASAHEQAELIAGGKADVVYANPFDAAAMVRDAGFQAVARPVGKADEMVIATGAASPANVVEDLQPGCKIAITDNRDVKLIGLRLLEPADLTEADVQWTMTDSFQAAARLAIKGEADAVFLLADAYHSLSKLSRAQLKPLIESRLSDITHVLLARPGLGEQAEQIVAALVALQDTPDGQQVAADLGMPGGFERMSHEDAEFMIDLMDTLLD